MASTATVSRRLFRRIKPVVVTVRVTSILSCAGDYKIVRFAFCHDTSILPEERFYESLPQGDMELHISNPEILPMFAEGRKFRLSLTEAQFTPAQ